MYQSSCPGAKTTWDDFSKFLLEKYKSKSSIYKELSAFITFPIQQPEDIREYTARIKTASAEAAIIVKSKYLESKSTALDID